MKGHIFLYTKPREFNFIRKSAYQHNLILKIQHLIPYLHFTTHHNYAHAEW